MGYECRVARDGAVALLIFPKSAYPDIHARRQLFPAEQLFPPHPFPDTFSHVSPIGSRCLCCLYLYERA